MAGPDYSTACRRHKTLNVRIPYRPVAQGLHLLVDSTGLKTKGEGEGKRKQHGAEYRRSRVETKIRCVKLMGERVLAWDFARRVPALRVCAANLNRFTQLGTPETVRMAGVRGRTTRTRFLQKNPSRVEN